MDEALKLLSFLGAVFLTMTFVFNLMPKWPRLPWDIFFNKFGFNLYIPWLSSLILSIILTLIFNFFQK